MKLADLINRILHLPPVGSKSFLTTIGDCSVAALITCDQMIGPCQVPVADVSLTSTAFFKGIQAARKTPSSSGDYLPSILGFHDRYDGNFFATLVEHDDVDCVIQKKTG
ncbi:hypothetical protein CONCODRAFT_167507 [Conidiobolus coronatus NRRL 28638]|uniref:FGAR-AT PurM N-terminal-like domain-containing protein n=1 Tax=Conidiobolus coronatus (strain ATCC 28846 / CBS 209.66 / NRRL 28638) TaxID=796925 RepID=A0A137PDU5_CONC2|nr:hypothetical protein CONCODRAFT_167507 [Conidiobolus coronatus NRRL 28638]|eukprot:KXN73176.1 hypothetical protein CONCODRAFT_167507 [Conidiobolus coronatus NRRL 28638]